jgi:hypothetical protein
MLKILDLFCCAGGSATGLKQACPDADIEGFDIEIQPDYPFKQFVLDWKEAKPEEYDFIWASPPCQGYIPYLSKKSRAKYPKLIDVVRERLLLSGKPFVIENVPGAPLRKDIMLCGSMFGLHVIRHRIFEIHGFSCKQPQKVCAEHKGKVISGEFIGAYRGGRPGCFGNKEQRNKLKAPTLESVQNAMGITHIKDFNRIVEAIPPAYAKFIMENYMETASKPIPPTDKSVGILGVIL